MGEAKPPTNVCASSTWRMTEPWNQHTRASLGHCYGAEERLQKIETDDEPRDAFKMRKFQNVNSRVGQHHVNTNTKGSATATNGRRGNLASSAPPKHASPRTYIQNSYVNRQPQLNESYLPADRQPVYGKPNRPSTAIDAVIAGQHAWKEEAPAPAKPNPWKMNQSWNQHTRASLGHHLGAEGRTSRINDAQAGVEQNAPAFTMRKFQNVSPRISTRRDQ